MTIAHKSLVASVIALCMGIFHVTPVSATSLKISPLRYDTILKAGEKQKGFVDITNPTTSSTRVKLSVQAFRQIDNNGSLEFYDSAVVSSGIQLDYSEIELASRETLHLAFYIDGSKLVSGDNFAAIFASSVPEGVAPGQQTVRVGTLLFISNGTPSTHEAVIENLSGNIFQIGSALDISFNVRNTAKAGTATGFSPMINVRAWPYLNETVTGPFVFAGRTRAVEYKKPGNYLGILAVKVRTGDSEQVMYRVVVTGFWRLVLLVSAVLVIVVIFMRRRLKKKSVNSSKID